MTTNQQRGSRVRPTQPWRVAEALNGTEWMDAEMPHVGERSLTARPLTCASVAEAVRRSTGAG